MSITISKENLEELCRAAFVDGYASADGHGTAPWDVSETKANFANLTTPLPDALPASKDAEAEPIGYLLSADLIVRLRARSDKWRANIAEWREMAPDVWTDELVQQLSPTIESEAADALAAKDTALSEMRAELERGREDAERWRALMSSQRMHFMGCAGIELTNKPGTTDRKLTNLIPVMKPGEYQHFGMEFWSEHSAFGNPEWPDDFERSLLVAYVDNLRAAHAASQDEREER